MKPLVSVVMPAYNAERYISEAIDSVLRQTFGNFEIIVVDDGSIDRTKEIAAQYGEKVKYVFQENGGPSKARNTGIKAAKGKYIAFLDADDLWTEEKLEVQMNFLRDHPYVGLVFADMAIFEGEKTLIDSYFKSIRIEGIYEKLVREREGLEDATALLLQCNTIPTGTVVVRQDCMSRAGLFDENMGTVEDLDLWIRISLFSKIGLIPGILKKKREHADNISRNYLKAVMADIYMVGKLRRNFPEPMSKYEMILRRRLARDYFDMGYYYFGRENTRVARSWFRKSLSSQWAWDVAFYAAFSLAPVSFIRFARSLKHWIVHRGVMLKSDR